MHALLSEERGVSSIVGIVLIIGLLTIAMAVYLREEVPVDWEEEEYKTMTEVKASFIDLRSRIQALKPGQVSTTEVRTGTPAPTPLLSTSSSAVLNVVGARYVDDAEEIYYYDTDFGSRYLHTYVSEAENTLNYRGENYDNDHLYVSTTQNNRMRTYLKFDLSKTGLYNRYDYVFEDDVEIHDVRLLIYSYDVDLADEPSDVMEVQVPLNVEIWAVENSAWDENITWITQPHNDDTEARDRKLDNTDVDGEGEWVGLGERDKSLTNYLKEKLEKLRGWGKWSQYSWWNPTATLEVGKFSSGYNNYFSIASANYGYYVEGTGPNGELWSSVFDAGDSNAYWNYADYDGTGNIELYFDNDSGWASPDGPYTPAQVENGIYGRYARYRIVVGDGEIVDNVIIEYTYHLSLVLREPEAWRTSTLRNQVKFISAEDWVARKDDLTPRLRITYSRTGRTPSANEGMIDLGYIEYRAQNQYFGDQYYIYEGGMIIGERYGWYDTVLAWPGDLVVITPVGSDKVRIEVTRYQIEPSSISGESAGGTGYTSIRVQREEEEWVVEPSVTPNRKEVILTINTDHPSPWRDYLERLAAEANYVISGYRDWNTYGDYVSYDYDSMSLTIYGKGRTIEDIYYSERVVWLDTSTGYFQGGRT